MFHNLEQLQSRGFQGFSTVDDLMNSRCKNVPTDQGVYLVLYPLSVPPSFLNESVGGHFKRKNPTVPTADLKSKWVSNTIVVYIGKAGGASSGATLKSRLTQYMRFGMGEPVGHWGGRYIWQIENNRSLLVCWKSLTDTEPRDFESRLIDAFVQEYGVLPFANLTS